LIQGVTQTWNPRVSSTTIEEGNKPKVTFWKTRERARWSGVSRVDNGRQEVLRGHALVSERGRGRDTSNEALHENAKGVQETNDEALRENAKTEAVRANKAAAREQESRDEKIEDVRPAARRHKR